MASTTRLRHLQDNLKDSESSNSKKKFDSFQEAIEKPYGESSRVVTSNDNRVNTQDSNEATGIKSKSKLSQLKTRIKSSNQISQKEKVDGKQKSPSETLISPPVGSQDKGFTREPSQTPAETRLQQLKKQIQQEELQEDITKAPTPSQLRPEQLKDFENPNSKYFDASKTKIQQQIRQSDAQGIYQLREEEPDKIISRIEKDRSRNYFLLQERARNAGYDIVQQGDSISFIDKSKTAERIKQLVEEGNITEAKALANSLELREQRLNSAATNFNVIENMTNKEAILLARRADQTERIKLLQRQELKGGPVSRADAGVAETGFKLKEKTTAKFYFSPNSTRPTLTRQSPEDAVVNYSFFSPSGTQIQSDKALFGSYGRGVSKQIREKPFSSVILPAAAAATISTGLQVGVASLPATGGVQAGAGVLAKTAGYGILGYYGVKTAVGTSQQPTTEAKLEFLGKSTVPLVSAIGGATAGTIAGRGIVKSRLAPKTGVTKINPETTRTITKTGKETITGTTKTFITQRKTFFGKSTTRTAKGILDLTGKPIKSGSETKTFTGTLKREGLTSKVKLKSKPITRTGQLETTGTIQTITGKNTITTDVKGVTSIAGKKPIGIVKQGRLIFQTTKPNEQVFATQTRLTTKGKILKFVELSKETVTKGSDPRTSTIEGANVPVPKTKTKFIFGKKGETKVTIPSQPFKPIDKPIPQDTIIKSSPIKSIKRATGLTLPTNVIATAGSSPIPNFITTPNLTITAITGGVLTGPKVGADPRLTNISTLGAPLSNLRALSVPTTITDFISPVDNETTGFSLSPSRSTTTSTTTSITEPISTPTTTVPTLIPIIPFIPFVPKLPTGSYQAQKKKKQTRKLKQKKLSGSPTLLQKFRGIKPQKKLLTQRVSGFEAIRGVPKKRFKFKFNT